MKKSELRHQIQTEIKSILSEETAEDIKDKTSAQSKLNKELEITKDLMKESINPEITKALSRFITAMSKRYGYSEQDAVYAIQSALKQRKYDGLNEEEDEDTMDKKASKSAKKGDSISKIANKLQQNSQEMKTVLNRWKNADLGEEKEKLINRLKELTKIKKELEGLL